jgi:hypothetical protein
MLRWVLIASLLVFLQDPLPEQLAEKLGDDDPKVREEAELKLVEIGESARRAVTKALGSTDLEVRRRALRILEELDLQAEERERECAARGQMLRLVSIDAADRSLRKILDELADQAHVRFRGDIPERQVSLEVSDMPLIQVLDRLGIQVVDTMPTLSPPMGPPTLTLKPGVPPEAVSYVAGARFWWTIRRWKNEGQIIRTTMDRDVQGLVEWDVAQVVRTSGSGFETCTIHSPREVYVPESDPGEMRIRIRGTRWWHCTRVLTFKDPRQGDYRRAGRFVVQVRWPSIHVTADRPCPPWVLYTSLRCLDVKVKYRNVGRRGNRSLAVGKGGGGRSIAQNPAWCGCEDAPSRHRRPKPARAQNLVVDVGWQGEELKEVESITVRFHKPVEECFELLSPALKAQR